MPIVAEIEWFRDPISHMLNTYFMVALILSVKLPRISGVVI